MDKMDKYRGGQRSDLGDRVNNFYSTTLGLKESRDFTVLAYSDYADTLVPTIIKWNNGETDDFRSRGKSISNRRETINKNRSDMKKLTPKEVAILKKLHKKTYIKTEKRDEIEAFNSLVSKGLVYIRKLNSRYFDGVIASADYAITGHGLHSYIKYRDKTQPKILRFSDVGMAYLEKSSLESKGFKVDALYISDPSGGYSGVDLVYNPNIKKGKPSKAMKRI